VAASKRNRKYNINNKHQQCELAKSIIKAAGWRRQKRGSSVSSAGIALAKRQPNGGEMWRVESLEEINVVSILNINLLYPAVKICLLSRKWRLAENHLWRSKAHQPMA
jgi:hypothetical protein